jgi:hypothetical protein
VIAMIDAGVHLQFPVGEPFDINFGKLTTQLRESLHERELLKRSTATELVLERNVAFMILTLLAHRLAEVTNAQLLRMTRSLPRATCMCGKPTIERKPLSASFREIST